MSDDRVRVPLNGKRIDLARLDVECGGHGLVASDVEVVAIAGSPVTEQELTAAVAAHVSPPDPSVIAANRDLLANRAASAIAANVAFAAIASPTQAQAIAHVKVLNKECTALIRLALGLVDSLDGT